jgi:hypothetical protein
MGMFVSPPDWSKTLWEAMSLLFLIGNVILGPDIWGWDGDLLTRGVFGLFAAIEMSVLLAVVGYAIFFLSGIISKS